MAVNRTKVLEAAQKFLSKGQYDKAIAEYQKLVGEDPRDVRTLLKIGDLHTRRNKPKDAIEIYEKVAELYAKQGFFLKAVAVYKQILKLDPTQLDATIKLAQMYEELALASDALSTYEQAADALLAQGQTDKALATMQRMIALDGQNVAARIKYAEALSKADRPREAATAFSDGARLLREQGRIDDYIRVVERQLYHDPDNVSIARELAGKYLERNDPKRALAKLQVCFKADPRDVQTLEMLAEAFRQLGQIPKTISVLKEIARLHAEVNADEPRRRTLTRVLDLDPADVEARQALAAPVGTPRVTRATDAGVPRVTRATDAGVPRVTQATDPSARRPAPQPQAAPVARPVEPVRTPPRRPEPEPETDSEEELSLDDAGEDSGEAVLIVADDSPGEELEPTVESLLAEADAHEANNDYLKAERALRNALLLDEELTELHERLKDVYLATDRRVDAVRELLWLSEAAEKADPSQAVSYARAALQLAPRAEATHRRLEALGLDPTTGEAPRSQAEEVVFVDDALDSAAEEPSWPTLGAPRRGFGDTPPSTQREPRAAREQPAEAAAQDPLDLPISPDEFDAKAPRARIRQMRPSDIAAFLDRPLSAQDFEIEAAAEFEPASSQSFDAEDAAAFDAGMPARAHETADVAALLDEPISPDEFDARPPGRPGTLSEAPAYDLLAEEPVDDFGLSDDRFDRSDLHEVSPFSEPALAGSRSRGLAVIEDEENYDELLSDDIVLPQEPRPTPADRQGAYARREQAFDDLGSDQTPAGQRPTRPPEATSADDEEGLGEAPEPTVPAEPIPELIRRSSQKGLDSITSETVRPAPLPQAAAASEVILAEVQEVLDEADFFASQELLDEALEAVQEAILIYPRSAALKARLAEYEAAADAKAEATRTREEEAALDESFDIAEQLASQLVDVPAPSGHDEMVDVESVFAQFKRGVAAQIAEDDTDTHFDLGIAYKEMGLIDDAIGEFEISAKSPKRACSAWTMVGMCHLEKGDALKAVSYFERALSQPAKAAAEELALNFEIANAYEVSDQLEKALASFEKVAARDRSFRGVTGRIDQLKRRGVSASASRATH